MHRSESEDSDDFYAFDDDEDDADGQGYASGGSEPRGNVMKRMNAMLKAGMKPVPGVSRVTIKNSKTKLYVFEKPDVYASPTSHKFVIFGKAELVDLISLLQTDNDLSNNVTVTGVEMDSEDIEFVKTQVGASREQAVNALKAADGDIDSAILKLAL